MCGKHWLKRKRSACLSVGQQAALPNLPKAFGHFPRLAHSGWCYNVSTEIQDLVGVEVQC